MTNIRPLNPTIATSGPRIVLGIDYGTTYTGLAWLQTNGQDDPTLKNVTLFRDWPGKNAPKVASAFSYSPTSSTTKCEQWGYSIDDHSNVMRWTKLDLEPHSTADELKILRELVKGCDLVRRLRTDMDAAINNDIPRHLSKDAEDVVRDYMRRVARQWFLHMKAGKYTLDHVPLDIVITHPASWSYEAMNKTFRAITGAFTRKLFPTRRHIYFASEPEACALYTVQNLLLNDRNTLIKGECFVLCDAGGGTIDLVSYRIDSVEPLEITRVGSISGGKYGSTFIDKAFLEWLQPRVRNLDIKPKDFGSGGHFVLGQRGRILLDRFERVKHAFTGTESGDISLPRGAIVADGEGEDLASGVISLTADDLQKMFEKSVNGAVRLIARQVTNVESNVVGENHVTNIFLSGGFSESDYLLDRVKRFADTTGHIKVQRASDCWGGVVKGAVLRGMGMGMDTPVEVTASPRHYGIKISQTYLDWRHEGESAVMDRFDGLQVVRGRILWLFNKGDAILPGNARVITHPIRYRFAVEDHRAGETRRLSFFATGIDNPPFNSSDFSKGQCEVVQLDIDLGSIPKASLQRKEYPRRGGQYYVFHADVELTISDVVIIRIVRDGKELRAYQTSL